MFNLSILQKYAKMFESSPSSLPPTLLLTNTKTSLTLFDKYPKAIYHFLVLPRILADSEFTAGDLTDLQTLLAKGKKAEAKTLIEGLKKDAEAVREMVEKEMIKRHGYKWDVWIGFHAVPSMVYVWERWRHNTRTLARFLTCLDPLSHLHLHVVSSDLCSQTLKHKKHYNSFHPKLGFFLHVDDVLSWFEGDNASFNNTVTNPCF